MVDEVVAADKVLETAENKLKQYLKYEQMAMHYKTTIKTRPVKIHFFYFWFWNENDVAAMVERTGENYSWTICSKFEEESLMKQWNN